MIQELRFRIFGLSAACLLAVQAAFCEPLRVVATTGMVADLARQIGGADASVSALMGPGVDPHLYKPTPSDLARLRQADVILYNGLGLEGKMSEIFISLSRRKPVVAVAAEIPRDRLIQHPDEAHADPHVWFDVALWAECLAIVEQTFSKVRPALKSEFASRATAARKELLELDAWVRAELDKIPKQKRVLVTSHDAFSYFGRAYDFEVVALQGISTASEAGLADISKLASFVRERQLPAVFIESSVSPRTLERVSRDSGARIGGELFSDAMGSSEQIVDGHPASTYPGMIRHNVRVIAAALAVQASNAPQVEGSR
jgi:manganese/zinc/iron transport system substrate-binding protein